MPENRMHAWVKMLQSCQTECPNCCLDPTTVYGNSAQKCDCNELHLLETIKPFEQPKMITIVNSYPAYSGNRDQTAGAI